MSSNQSLNKIIFNNLLKSKIALLAFFFIGAFFLISIFSYQLMPDNTKMANSINLSIAKKKPGFTQLFVLQKKQLLPVKQSRFEKFFFGTNPTHKKIAINNIRIEENSIICSMYPHSTIEKIPISNLYVNKVGSYTESKLFILGTDMYGRDLLSRIILGTRISFSVGFIAVLISILVGLPLGMIAGYYGGRVDSFICWVINVVWSIPTLLLVIAISIILGKGFWQVFIAVGLTMWVEVARVSRGEVLKISQLPYIELVKSFGLSDFKIIYKHILPNIINPIIIISAANFATSVLLESGLSFLGIGVQPPVPSWGMIIRNHYGFIIMDKAYLSFWPGICIVLLVLSFILLGNALRDALDTKLENN
jgi:peptide/nickel transport system permease protein